MAEPPRRAAWSAAWGVVAVVFGGGAVAAWAPEVSVGHKIATWPAWTLCAITLVALYMCFALLFGRWPASSAPRPGTQTTVQSPLKPGSIDLIAEQAGDHLRLGLLNRGAVAEFSAAVIDIQDPLGRRIGPQHWPIPWLEDGSSEPKRVLVGQTRMLDFARYDRTAVSAELNTSCGSVDHWSFSSVPTPVGARYYNLRSVADLDEQRFTLTVRTMNASSGNYFDWPLRVGTCGSKLVCEVRDSRMVTNG